MSGTTDAESDQLATISSAVPFTLQSAYVTSAYNDGLSILVEGLRAGTLKYTQTLIVNTEAPVRVDFGYQDIDELRFTPSGGT